MTRRALALGVAVALALAAPTAADAATATWIAMFSDSGDYIGAGQQQLFTPGNSQIGVTGNPGDISISVNGGATPGNWTLEFAAPPGETLRPGVYDTAQRAPFRNGGHPGIDITGDSRGCNEDAGRFEVKDIAFAGSALQRLWLVYEQHCEGGPAALFGEVRIGEPVADGPAVGAPAIVRWPTIDIGASGTAVPVTFLASGNASLGSASLGGRDPGDFIVRLDDCRGKSLTAGESCQVWLRFVPKTAGTRLATLRVPGGGDVALQGFDYGGTTRVLMRSDQGDYIGAGQTWSYTPANAVIAASGTRQGVGFSVNGANGDWWYAHFVPASGDILAPGTYPNATRYPFNGSGPGIDVSGNGRGCNTETGQFTVTDASFQADGSLRTFGATFEQHCEGATPALRGEFDYRAGDKTSPAPWMAGGSALPSGPSGALVDPCSLTALTGARVIHASRRQRLVRGTGGADAIFGGPGKDHVIARAGNDCVEGRAGKDRVDGGAGNDALFGGPGNDVIIGSRGRDYIDCGPGHDVAFASPGDLVRGCERVIRHRRHRRGR